MSEQTMAKNEKLKNFKSAAELAEYLNVIEQRLEKLEIENTRLKKRAKSESKSLNSDLNFIYDILPATSLLSKKFLGRAFAVWGHFFVANLLISIVLGIVYFLFTATLFASILR